VFEANFGNYLNLSLKPQQVCVVIMMGGGLSFPILCIISDPPSSPLVFEASSIYITLSGENKFLVVVVATCDAAVLVS
jgi:hypothetical protein